MAAWQVRPPRLVTMAAAVFITVPQSGVVMSATSTSPGWNSDNAATLSITRARPVATLVPTARPVASAGALPPSTYSSSTWPRTCEATVSGRACTI